MRRVNVSQFFRERNCDYWREYPYAYCCLRVIDRTVQIVGADCGSSALFLLWKGARFIIQYEKDEAVRKKWGEVCAEFDICDKAVMKGEWTGQYEDVDVFIMDCEGCESGLDVPALKKYQQWCIAIHDWTEGRVNLLRKLQGYTFTYVTDDGREIVICNLGVRV